MLKVCPVIPLKNCKVFSGQTLSNQSETAMNKDKIKELSAEEIVELLIANLSECNTLLSILGTKAEFDQKNVRKLRNELMFARTKARNLARELEEMKKPTNTFKLSS